MKKHILTLLFLIAVLGAGAQHKKYKQGIKVPCPVCYASDKIDKTRIPAPREFLLKSGGGAKSDIIVEYKGFSDTAKAAFAYAVEIWESIIESEIPIHMDARWESLNQNVLGSCGPETYYANFKDAPVENKYYAVSLAEKIAKEELNGKSRYDMVARFNKNIDWYFGTDLNTPIDKYDFVSVVLHEIGHGLGFTGFFFVDEDVGGYGFYQMGDATSYDFLVQNNLGKQLINPSFYDNLSASLKLVLERSLVANSPVAMKKNNRNKPRLYAPSDFDDGSSVYHLNDLTYDGTTNALMTHAVARGEAIHDPGPLSRGILDDIGWKNLFIHFEPTKDKEQLQSVDFNVSLESDYGIDSSALYIIYSTDNFQTHSDSLILMQAAESGFLSASLNPDSSTSEITYYVQAADTMNRIRTSPSTVPEKYHRVKFGPDTEGPVISHEAIPFFLKMEEPLTITVDATDNLGIDTVYITYSINGIEQEAFGLTRITYGKYSGTFNVDIENLSDGDKIEYTIFASDSSAAKNSVRLPVGEDKFSFTIEEIYEPVSSYTNNFDNSSSDFILTDFAIYAPKGFENGALHSPHPYLSPNVDNKDLEFWTFLKRPIIVQDSGTISYDEVVLVEPGEFESKYGDDDFWDFVIVEASKNMGESWKPLTDGYDSGSQLVWSQNYNANIVDQVSKTLGKSEWYYNREINLLESGNFAVGDTLLIRFRLYSDPYASGWGWAIDNLRIQQPVAAKEIGRLADIKIFPNPFNSTVHISGSLPEFIADIRIDVFDVFGKKVFSKIQNEVYGACNETVHLDQLRSGLYLMHISANGKLLQSKKLIKN